MQYRRLIAVLVWLLTLVLTPSLLRAAGPLDWQALAPYGEKLESVALRDGSAELRGRARWGYLATSDLYTDVTASVTFTIREPAQQFEFFGRTWSVWPDRLYGDQGYDAALLLRAGDECGYRVQLSHKYQDVALVRYPEGGYLRVVACDVPLNEPQKIEVTLQGNEIVVRVNGEEKIRYRDPLQPLGEGRVAVGTSSLARVQFQELTIEPATPTATVAAPAVHQPRFQARCWLGDRPWIFDGDEPIMMLGTAGQNYINNVKLRPGYKPQLSWNSHWDIQNQGAYPEGTNSSSDPSVTGGGETLTVSWTGKHTLERFVTRTTMTVGFDQQRQTYTYDVDSELEVLPGEPFEFRYGYDFEHHTPLDPFRWQYLIVRREGNVLNHRPVHSVDPGLMTGVQQDGGLRVWYGRHNEPVAVVPAVEYYIRPEMNRDPKQLDQPLRRVCNTAVCAAFYDTGVSFARETAPPGTRVRVKYRYTGYTPEETEALFQASTVYDSPMLDSEHHYIFAEWPTIDFGQFVPMSQSWIYGRTPFMTGHNQRPTYELVRGTGIGSGYAMKLGPGAYGAAALPMTSPLQPGEYVLQAWCKSQGVLGPGGRIELKVTEDKTGRPLAEYVHYVGAGSFEWQPIGFVFRVPEGAGGLQLGFGNGGTGEVFFAEVKFEQLAKSATLPEYVLPEPNPRPAELPASPRGAIADYRMTEGAGLHVYDHARGPFGMLELANITWVEDEGRPALRFADSDATASRYPRAGSLHRNYFALPSYEDRDHLPLAVSGYHGGSSLQLGEFTIATFIKPAAEMGRGEHTGKGDLVGLGARRFILRLEGQHPPYRLAAALNVNDQFVSDVELDADRWYHVAMTGTTEQGKWRVRLFVDGKPVHSGLSNHLEAPLSMPESLILGAELFYFHDAYYRGLIGRTLVFDRALNEEELTLLATGKED